MAGRDASATTSRRMYILSASRASKWGSVELYVVPLSIQELPSYFKIEISHCEFGLQLLKLFSYTERRIAFCGPYKSQSRRIVAEHCPADQFHRHPSLLHEFIMKLLKREIRSHFGPIILAKLENLELSQGVDKICRV